jgi:hypothetical protein
MNNTFKALTSIALLASTAQFAEAHSGFKTSTLSSADTAATSWNAINITHGCGDVAGTTKKDVIALSILFPVAATADDFKANILVSKSVGTAAAVVDSSYDSSSDFDFGTTPTPTLTAITAGNLFPNTIPIAVTGKIVGFQSWLGKPNVGGSPILETATDDKGAIVNTTGSGIFGLSKVVFKSDSCVKTLKLYAASVNWCESGKKSFQSKTRLDAWVELPGTVFGETSDITDVAHPPKLTINRDLDKTKITATDCEGKADTVILQPSVNFINNYLPIKSAKWPKGTSGQLFWPTVK